MRVLLSPTWNVSLIGGSKGQTLCFVHQPPSREGLQTYTGPFSKVHRETIAAELNERRPLGRKMAIGKEAEGPVRFACFFTAACCPPTPATFGMHTNPGSKMLSYVAPWNRHSAHIWAQTQAYPTINRKKKSMIPKKNTKKCILSFSAQLHKWTIESDCACH